MKRITVIAAFIVFLLAPSCGFKRLLDSPIATHNLVYEGSLVGNFRSSPKLTGWFRDVERCMGVEGTEPPLIRVFEGNRVWCPNPDGSTSLRFGCHRSGTVIMPRSGLENVWKHEFVHYILWRERGDGDAEHRDRAFRLCSGLVLLPGEPAR